jgi:hypothetical protein
VGAGSWNPPLQQFHFADIQYECDFILKKPIIADGHKSPCDVKPVDPKGNSTAMGNNPVLTPGTLPGKSGIRTRGPFLQQFEDTPT